MNYLSSQHIDFVPNKTLKNEYKADFDYIAVFSKKFGNKIYKRKNKFLGIIGFNKDTKDYSFQSVGTINFSFLSLKIITIFINQLNTGKIKFNAREGELCII